jgi:hypothetical protein
VGGPNRGWLGSLLGLTGVGHLMKDSLLWGEEYVLNYERKCFRINPVRYFEVAFGASPFVNSNTWY